jgi:hypothetical protein
MFFRRECFSCTQLMNVFIMIKLLNGQFKPGFTFDLNLQLLVS